MPKIMAQIPEDLYKNLKEEVRMGVFSDISEAVSISLQKVYARKSRTFLRWLMKKEGITETEMLKELEGLRR